METKLTPRQIAGISRQHGSLFAAIYTIARRNEFTLEVDGYGWTEGLAPTQLATLRRASLKRYCAKQDKRREETALYRKHARGAFLRFLNARRKGRIVRTKFKALELWDLFTNQLDNNDYQDLAVYPQSRPMQRQLGRFIADYERHVINEMMPKKVELARHLALPLYACSGELEADNMQSERIIRISRGVASQNRVTARWKQSEALNFATDGGGQAETQFLIRPELARIACGLVRTIGRPQRNGGHIHINCRMDEQIGERVFDALRYHLSWTRWLVPVARRRHNWASVNNTPYRFTNAKRIKACAVSANTWHTTGTVEMRLWPTSDKAEVWLGRRDLMQGIAKWSETHASRTGDDPAAISQTTAVVAWESFFRWAAVNAPEGLSYALKVLRKKARAVRGEGVEKRACTDLMRIFENARITVRGYRTRNRVTSTL